MHAAVVFTKLFDKLDNPVSNLASLDTDTEVMNNRRVNLIEEIIASSMFYFNEIFNYTHI